MRRICAAIDQSRRRCHRTGLESPDAFASGIILGECQYLSLWFRLRADVKGLVQHGIIPYRSLKPDAKAETVRLLIEHGADLAARDKTHSTPLHMTTRLQSAKSVQLLIEHGADVNTQNETYLTPLHLVSAWVSVKASSFLTHCKTDVGGWTG